MNRKPAACFTEIDLTEQKKTLERVRQVWDTGQPLWLLPKETRLELCAAFDIKVYCNRFIMINGNGAARLYFPSVSSFDKMFMCSSGVLSSPGRGVPNLQKKTSTNVFLFYYHVFSFSFEV